VSEKDDGMTKLEGPAVDRRNEGSDDLLEALGGDEASLLLEVVGWVKRGVSEEREARKRRKGNAPRICKAVFRFRLSCFFGAAFFPFPFAAFFPFPFFDR
jgi:hypothetical protein